MTFYIGVDFHPHQQTLCWCDSGTGETGSLKLEMRVEISHITRGQITRGNKSI